MPFKYLFTAISLYECARYVLSHICMPDLSNCIVTLYIIFVCIRPRNEKFPKSF